jgi:glutamine amidotransferase
MIAIIDYGMGNIHSVQKALESMGAQTLVTNSPLDIKSCDKAVLPGVGAFGDAMAEIKKQKLIPSIKEHIKKNKPFLGICLGMHLLFDSSEESPGIKGLGILKGTINKFQAQNMMKVPHIGWNQLNRVQRTGHRVERECPLLKDIADSSYLYFCHSYYPEPKDKSVIAATTDYLRDFTSIVWKDNIYGVQFHPEKSQSAGLKILENFVKL